MADYKLKRIQKVEDKVLSSLNEVALKHLKVTNILTTREFTNTKEHRVETWGGYIIHVKTLGDIFVNVGLISGKEWLYTLEGVRCEYFKQFNNKEEFENELLKLK